jgi:hypothetical protein
VLHRNAPAVFVAHGVLVVFVPEHLLLSAAALPRLPGKPTNVTFCFLKIHLSSSVCMYVCMYIYVVVLTSITLLHVASLQVNQKYLHMSNYFFSVGDDVVSAYLSGIQFMPVGSRY